MYYTITDVVKLTQVDLLNRKYIQSNVKSNWRANFKLKDPKQSNKQNV